MCGEISWINFIFIKFKNNRRGSCKINQHWRIDDIVIEVYSELSFILTLIYCCINFKIISIDCLIISESSFLDYFVGSVCPQSVVKNNLSSPRTSLRLLFSRFSFPWWDWNLEIFLHPVQDRIPEGISDRILRTTRKH